MYNVLCNVHNLFRLQLLNEYIHANMVYCNIQMGYNTTNKKIKQNSEFQNMYKMDSIDNANQLKAAWYQIYETSYKA